MSPEFRRIAPKLKFVAPKIQIFYPKFLYHQNSPALYEKNSLNPTSLSLNNPLIGVSTKSKSIPLAYTRKQTAHTRAHVHTLQSVCTQICTLMSKHLCNVRAYICNGSQDARGRNKRTTGRPNVIQSIN